MSAWLRVRLCDLGIHRADLAVGPSDLTDVPVESLGGAHQVLIGFSAVHNRSPIALAEFIHVIRYGNLRATDDTCRHGGATHGKYERFAAQA